MKHIVIIGAGMAGYGLARAIKRENSEAMITIICADSGHSYSKPMLSTILQDGRTPTDIIQLKSEDVESILNVKLIPNTRVNRVDSVSQSLNLTNGKSIKYDSLVLATGSRPLRPQIKGIDSKRVKQVNSLEEYEDYFRNLRPDTSIAVLGGGLIGCEFVNDLLCAGFRVNLIERSDQLLNGLVPKKISNRLQKIFESKGANILKGKALKQIDEKGDELLLHTDSSEKLYCDLLLTAVGITPNTCLAKTMGINVNRAIEVNSYLETNIKNIYAIGDCAEVEGSWKPYVAPLIAQCSALSKTLSNNPTKVNYGPMPIAVKTSLFPIIALPGTTTNLREKTTVNDNGIKTLYIDEKGHLNSMVLSGKYVSDRSQLIKEVQNPKSTEELQEV